MTRDEPLQTRLPIAEDLDVVIARNAVRAVARSEGLPRAAVEALATATSEIATNVRDHARSGEILLSVVVENGRRGVSVTVSDDGPGIPDLELAMRDGYSTAGGLGLGLSSARRLVDELEIVSVVGKGTTVIMTKWV